MMDKKKLTVLDKLKVFFEKYFGLVSPTEPVSEHKVVDHQDIMGNTPLGMVAEGSVSYGNVK